MIAPLAMKLMQPFAHDTADAAVPLVELCTRVLRPEEHGRFFCGSRMVDVPPCNDEDARRLWALSAQLVGVEVA